MKKLAFLLTILQGDVLDLSYGTKDPNHHTAVSKELKRTFDLFPVDKETAVYKCLL